LPSDCSTMGPQHPAEGKAFCKGRHLCFAVATLLPDSPYLALPVLRLVDVHSSGEQRHMHLKSFVFQHPTPVLTLH
jgi:hypothetical protein